MKRILQFILVSFFIAGKAYPQLTPCFTLDKEAVCINELVKINDCSGYTGTGTAPQYRYNSNYPADPRDTVFTNTNIYTYSIPGKYRIIQYVTTNAGLRTFEDTITVLPLDPPSFDLLVCEGREVTVKITDPYKGSYGIDFGDGSALITVPYTSSPIHIYPNTLPRNITVSGGCGAPNQKPVTPIENLTKPDLIVMNEKDVPGSVTIQLNAFSYFKYQVLQKIGNGSFQPIDTIHNQSGITNLTYNFNQSQQTCYRLVNFDDCGNTDSSETLCTNILNASAQNNQNQVSWQAFPGANFSRYVLYRDSVAISSFNNIAGTSYTDTDIICGKNYCYFVATELTENNLVNSQAVQSRSDIKCVSGISNNIPPALQNIVSTIEGNRVRITWDNQNIRVTEYSIIRSDNPNPINFTSGPPFYDDNINVADTSYCYRIQYRDSCGNTAPLSASTCSVVLKVNQPDLETNVLNWTPYNNLNSGVSYLLEIFDGNNNLIASRNLTGTTYTDGPIDPNLTVIRYRITASINGEISYSNIVEIRNELKIYVPNAFTPNGDNMNDYFVAMGKFINEFEITIYNRWGEIVFQSTSMSEGWDGYYNGSPATVDNYAYLITATDKKGNHLSQKGVLTLLR